jgi:hypothetical protein
MKLPGMSVLSKKLGQSQLKSSVFSEKLAEDFALSFPPRHDFFSAQAYAEQVPAALVVCRAKEKKFSPSGFVG